MDKVTISRTITVQQRALVDQWLRCSALLLVSLCTLLVLLTLYYSYALFHVRKLNKECEKELLDVVLIEKQCADIAQQERQLKRYTEKFNKISQNLASVVSSLTIISTTIPDDIALTRIAYCNKQWQFSGQSKRHESVTTFMNKLCTSQNFGSIKITSLNHQMREEKKLILFSLEQRLEKQARA